MTQHAKGPLPPSQFMSPEEVARELGYKSKRIAYDLAYAGELEYIGASPKGTSLRITRASFDAYCTRRLAQAAASRTKAKAS